MRCYGRWHKRVGVRHLVTEDLQDGFELAGAASIMRGPERPKSHQPPSSCRCIDPIGLHEEISRDFPTCMDFLNHLQSKGAAPSQDFRRARTRAENICKLGLAVTELLDRVTKHIHRVEPAPAPEWPAPFLIGLDQCHE